MWTLSLNQNAVYGVGAKSTDLDCDFILTWIQVWGHYLVEIFISQVVTSWQKQLGFGLKYYVLID